jgi:hypothetical protein
MVLALETSEIATHGSQGEGSRPGKEVKEGFLFNRINTQGDRSAENEGIKGSTSILPDTAETSF